MINDNGWAEMNEARFLCFYHSRRERNKSSCVSGEGEVTPAHQQTRELRVQIVLHQVTRPTFVNPGGYRVDYRAMLTCGGV